MITLFSDYETRRKATVDDILTYKLYASQVMGKRADLHVDDLEQIAFTVEHRKPLDRFFSFLGLKPEMQESVDFHRTLYMGFAKYGQKPPEGYLGGSIDEAFKNPEDNEDIIKKESANRLIRAFGLFEMFYNCSKVLSYIDLENSKFFRTHDGSNGFISNEAEISPERANQIGGWFHAQHNVNSYIFNALSHLSLMGKFDFEEREKLTLDASHYLANQYYKNGGAEKLREAVEQSGIHELHELHELHV